MKKLVAVLLVSALGATATAQEISSYSQYKINEGVSVEVKKLKRVEQYGWDNFEVVYRLKNNTDFDLFKLDLTLYLVDKHDREVGTVEIHDFKVPKNSDEEYHYVDLHSPYVNEKFDKIVVVKNNIEVQVDTPRAVSIAKINCEPTFSMK
ncbi:hypothetical protein SAMN04488029_4065 [Reichenbachiella faecimaris]|uniref:DUF4352 domain-containing protein n=1 Tax=Reichenbachiella faecimaris TaxID=692418 RepID=A0A1W2GRA2_REIFA|nr:hypothetical protein [Reichenbachiella faecimaris]SMD39141.1 hypothetical protein SAMN04488029_4065 [Reichenbachiella faecimaris]